MIAYVTPRGPCPSTESIRPSAFTLHIMTSTLTISDRDMESACPFLVGQEMSGGAEVTTTQRNQTN